MTAFTIIIPARLASSRLAEKLLQPIGNKTVLEHSYRAAESSGASAVVIATDDKKLFEVATTFADKVVMTSPAHQSGTDRLAECVQLLQLPDDEIIVNLQADEPFMPPKLIRLCAQTLANDDDVPVATLAARVRENEEIQNPDVVKVVINRQGQAMYFSRAGIPFNRDGIALDNSRHYFHHLGIYAYRAGFLKRYAELEPSEIEHIEKLEQLRILDAGERIAVAVVDDKPPKGIDTQADLMRARAHWQVLSD